MFGASDQLRDLLVGAITSAPGSATPIEMVAAALLAAGVPFSDERRDYSRRRNGIIAANADLRERELIKLATLASAIGEAPRRRGVAEPAASLTAEAGMAVFRVAFDRWVDKANSRSWEAIVRELLAELKVR